MGAGGGVRPLTRLTSSPGWTSSAPLPLRQVLRVHLLLRADANSMRPHRLIWHLNPETKGKEYNPADFKAPDLSLMAKHSYGSAGSQDEEGTLKGGSPSSTAAQTTPTQTTTTTGTGTGTPAQTTPAQTTSTTTGGTETTPT